MDRNKRCTFFGHRDFSMLEYKNYIEEIFEYLIINKEVDEFFSGGMGNFDRICEGIVRKLMKKYPQVELKLIMPLTGYMSLKYLQKNLDFYNEIIIPNTGKSADSTESITKRNKYMVDKCRFFLSGIYKEKGGSVTALNYAISRKDVRIINIFKKQS